MMSWLFSYLNCMICGVLLSRHLVKITPRFEPSMLSRVIICRDYQPRYRCYCLTVLTMDVRYLRTCCRRESNPQSVKACGLKPHAYTISATAAYLDRWESNPLWNISSRLKVLCHPNRRLSIKKGEAGFT